MDALVRAEPLQLLLLQDAQQLDLLRQRHAFDLVEEQGTAMGMLELADALALRAGEGTALMTEQLALEQLLGNRRAVQRHERLVGARPEVVQAAGNQFLAAAGLATDQDVHRGRRQGQNLPAQRFHRLGHAEQTRIDLVLETGLLLQAPVLQHQAALFQRAPQTAEQALGREGFLDEVVGALAHGLHRHRHVAVPGDHDHRQVAIDRLQVGEQLQAVHAGHIADDHPGEGLVQRSQAFLGAQAQAHLEAGQLQPLLHRFADRRFVVDEDHLVAHVVTLVSSGAAGRIRLNTAPASALATCRRPPSSWTIP